MAVEQQNYERLHGQGVAFLRWKFFFKLTYQDMEDIVSEILDEEILGMADDARRKQYFLGRLHNKAIDYMRRNNAKKRGEGRVESLDELTGKVWAVDARFHDTGSREIVEGLRECIRRLKPQPQRVMSLFADGVRQTEIAGELGVTRARISQLFSESVGLLRQCLASKGMEGDDFFTKRNLP